MKKGTIAGITVALAVAGGAAYYFYPKTSTDENKMSSIEIYPSSTISIGGSRKKRCQNKNKNKKSKKH